MPWQRTEERIPPTYDRNAIVESNGKEDFKSMLKEAKNLEKRRTKEVLRVSNKPIVKQRLVHLYVSGYYSNRQIARILCISEATVGKLLRDEEVKNMIQHYQDAENEVVDTALKALRLKAVETQSELLDDDNSVVRANVAKDILDRTGHKAKDKKEININMTYEERLLSLVEQTNNFVEATVIDDDSQEISTEGDV